MTYLLDANVFIQAKNLHYGLDFCPAFWDWLIESNTSGKVFSIEKVGDELEAGADELADWASNLGQSFFLKPDAPVVPALATVSSWATGQRYDPAAVSTFLQVADYYLVAHALAHEHVVVTHEKPDNSTLVRSHEKPDNSTKRIKIPVACIGLDIKCMTPYEMLRRERARFVLGRAPTPNDARP